MLLSNVSRHELPPDASSNEITSRVRDRVEALAITLGQQAELGLIELLASGQGGAEPCSAASNLPAQLQPCIAHVAATVATAFRHSSLKLVLPELHRLLEAASSSSAAAQQLDADQHPHVLQGPGSRAATPRTSAPATAPPTPDTNSAAAHAGSPVPPSLSHGPTMPLEEGGSLLPQLAPTWSLEDGSAAYMQGFALHAGGNPPGLELHQQEYGNGNGYSGGGSHHGPIGSPPVRRPNFSLLEQQQQQQHLRRISAGMFDQQSQQSGSQLMQRRSLAGPPGPPGGLSDLAPLMVPNNHFSPRDPTSAGMTARPRASCEVSVPPPPPSGPSPSPFTALQRSASEVPAHAFGPFDEGGSAVAVPTAFRGLTISSPPTQMRREDASWMVGYDKCQPPLPAPTSGSNPGRSSEAADLSEYNGSTAPGTDVSSGSNCTTPLSSETAAAAAVMAAVQQHLQQQQQQEQHATFLALSGRTLSGQFGMGMAAISDSQQQQQQAGDELLSMLHSMSDAAAAGGTPPTYMGHGGAGGQAISALAMANSWRSGPNTPAITARPTSQDTPQPPGRSATAVAGMGLLSASLAHGHGQASAQGQEQVQANAQVPRMDMMRMATPRPDTSDIFAHSVSMPMPGSGNVGPGSAHSLPGTNSLSPFDHHGLPTLSELLLMSPPSSAAVGQRGASPYAQQQQQQQQGSGASGMGALAASSAAATLARCNSSSAALRDGSSLSPQQQQQQSAFGIPAGSASAGGAALSLQPQGPLPSTGSTPLQQYQSSGSTSASAMLRSSHSGAVYAAASALARGMSCPTSELPDVPGRFKVLPDAVQQRIMTLTAANPVITVKDFDEKVVSKMSLLVDMHGTDEALAMLLHLEHRMRTKQGVMKNGPGYLDVAVSSHLDMLKAQGSCPKNMTTEEYAAHTLSPVVLHELREAVQNSKWLQWSHLDQGIIQLIKKLPRDSAVEKLQEISYHSFKNVDNIKGCIMSILNSRIREDRRKQ